jgi:hypothetical protein
MKPTRLAIALALAAFCPSLVAAGAAQQPNAVAPPPPELVGYAALREAKLGGEVVTVSNLALKRDAGTLTLKSGEVYFVAPVAGRVTAAVFVGDGEFALTPPIECEKQALAIYTKAPSITEHFAELVLRFSDDTAAEIRASAGAVVGAGGPHADRAASVLAENAKLLREKLRTNYALRTFADVSSSEKDRRGYFTAFVKGDRWSKLIYMTDPTGLSFVAPEQVALVSYDDSNGGVWTSFPMSKGALADARTYDIKQHDIEVTIDGTTLRAKDTITLRALRDGVRVLPFELFPTLRVSKVTDASGASVAFVQQDKDEDAEFAVVFARPVPSDADTTVTVEYAGDEALHDSGGGNFILLPRSTWYPNNGSSAFGDRSRFRTTYIVPRKTVVVGTGALAGPEVEEGDLKVSRWTSGDLELAVTGFNYGRFKEKEIKDPDTGYTIEFYANRDVPNEIKQMQQNIEAYETQTGNHTDTTLGAISTTGMADSALADAQNATRIYDLYFGKLPYTRVAMTQQPAGFFGQAWPTLVYMPFTAFLDATIRTQMLGTRNGTNDFFTYVGPHELAHQWWGHVVGWTSYRDQWMSEGFAEFSASLYVQRVKGPEKFTEFWEEHRKQIVDGGPSTNNKPPYTFGPVTQGFRLNAPKANGVYRLLVYPKGAYILHMIRMLMYSPQTGDADFQAMMKDFVQTYYNKDASTEDFKAAVEKHMTPAMNLGGDARMNWFFDEWVYGTEVPSYAFEYSFRDENGKTVLVGKLTQSGVSDGFRMQVPVYLDFGKGWARLGQVPVVGNATKEFRVPLPQRPKRAAVNALNDVLCVSTTNAGK